MKCEKCKKEIEAAEEEDKEEDKEEELTAGEMMSKPSGLI